MAADDLEDADGLLTPKGMQVASSYAAQWLEGTRDLETERSFPALAGLFYDIRMDDELAHRYGDPEEDWTGVLKSELLASFSPSVTAKPVVLTLDMLKTAVAGSFK